jgi:hypothetical protein
MKKSFLTLAIIALCTIGANAQTKKDGTPDMRYKANKETYGNSYSTTSYSTPSYSTPKSPTPSYTEPKTERNYSNGGQYKLQDGYQKSNGSYVAPHIKTTPDNNTYNNYKPKK